MTLEEVAEELEIDLVTALDRVVDNRVLYISLLKVFVDDTDMNKARQAVAQKDYKSVEEYVHSMKGASVSLNLPKISQACHKTVMACRSQEYHRIEDLFMEVEKEYAVVQALVSKINP